MGQRARILRLIHREHGERPLGPVERPRGGTVEEQAEAFATVSQLGQRGAGRVWTVQYSITVQVEAIAPRRVPVVSASLGAEDVRARRGSAGSVESISDHRVPGYPGGLAVAEQLQAEPVAGDEVSRVAAADHVVEEGADAVSDEEIPLHPGLGGRLQDQPERPTAGIPRKDVVPNHQPVRVHDHRARGAPVEDVPLEPVEVTEHVVQAEAHARHAIAAYLGAVGVLEIHAVPHPGDPAVVDAACRAR